MRASESTRPFHSGMVLGFPDTYVFAKDEHALRRRTADESIARLRSDHRVRWAEQLYEKSRVKRDIYDPDRLLHRVKRLQELSIPVDELNNRQPVNDSMLFNDELWSHQWYLREIKKHMATVHFTKVLELLKMRHAKVAAEDSGVFRGVMGVMTP
ncbi:Neuroendocrine convertase 1 [Eumeta japonica]|uniref:Neuroendocrine convertase 1 n=1 Tax=Eumeta variegata TaxID=151549 RepID=A0A4C1U7G2_EUMVA|nr:Neuroendocrine convertase 1 [Eumeta japonica]